MRKADDPLIRQMQRWGQSQVHHAAGGGECDHPLGAVIDMAPGTREAALSTLIGRDGEARRRRMAEGAGIPGMRIVPEWACDPVRGRNDADPPRAVAAVDGETPDDLRWIDRALAEIGRQNRMRAAVVRAEFAEVGSQERKARIVAKAYGGALSVHQYRRELRLGMDWLRMRSSRAQAA